MFIAYITWNCAGMQFSFEVSSHLHKVTPFSVLQVSKDAELPL